tara:strand:- start:888 stop:1130 length:243 start_codon:yes stop_codon:yes gene_type:complete
MQNVFTALNARSQWEEITKAFKFPDISKHQGTIENLMWFLSEGKKSNARRKNCTEAIRLAQVILENKHEEAKPYNKPENN